MLLHGSGMVIVLELCALKNNIMHFYLIINYIFTCVREVSLKKRYSSTFLGHLSFGVSGMESPLISLLGGNHVRVVCKRV